MQDSSDDPYRLQDLKEINMDCWSTLDFDQWRLEHHPEHLLIPEMPTFTSQESNQN